MPYHPASPCDESYGCELFHVKAMKTPRQKRLKAAAWLAVTSLALPGLTIWFLNLWIAAVANARRGNGFEVLKAMSVCSSAMAARNVFIAVVVFSAGGLLLSLLLVLKEDQVRPDL